MIALATLAVLPGKLQAAEDGSYIDWIHNYNNTNELRLRIADYVDGQTFHRINPAIHSALMLVFYLTNLLDIPAKSHLNSPRSQFQMNLSSWISTG